MQFDPPVVGPAKDSRHSERLGNINNAGPSLPVWIPPIQGLASSLFGVLSLTWILS